MKKQIFAACIFSLLGIFSALLSYFSLIKTDNTDNGLIFFTISVVFAFYRHTFEQWQESKASQIMTVLHSIIIRSFIFILAYLSNIGNTLPIIVAIISFFTFILFNRKINKIEKRIFVNEVTKKLCGTEYLALIIWFVILSINKSHADLIGVIFLWIITFITTTRFFYYGIEYSYLKDSNSD